MRVGYRCDGARLWLDLVPEERELTAAASPGGGSALDPEGPREVFLDLPPGVMSLEDIHPDLLALVTLLVVAPFVRGGLELGRPVSQAFAEIVAEHLGMPIGPVDPTLTPRERPRSGAITALSFSGGVDSCAASMMLPDDTVHVFLQRQGRQGLRPSLYRSEAALASLRAAQRAGREVVATRTNLELVRKPYGYPVDWSTAAPAVLTAATRPVAEVAFGVILEAAYSLSKKGYRTQAGGAALARWAPVFAAVGMPITLPLASVSEVVTARMVLTDGAHLRPQTCVRGLPGRPCGVCTKCFRKGLIDAAWTGRPPRDRDVSRALLSPSVKTLVRAAPMRCEISIAWSLDRLPELSHPLLRALLEKTTPAREYADRLAFLTAIHPPALELMSASSRPGVVRRLETFAPMADEAQVAAVQGWDATALVSDEAYQRGQRRVLDLVPLERSLVHRVRHRGRELAWSTAAAVHGIVSRHPRSRPRSRR